METFAAVLIAIGQTLTLVGAVIVAVSAYRRAQRKSKATYEMLREFDKVIDRRLLQSSIGVGSLVVLAGLVLAASGAWLQV